MVLEEYEHAKARGAKIYAELAGFGMSADAGHMTAPNMDGPRRAMLSAMRNAGVNADQVDYLNAHGTSTPLGDVNESNAIKAALGDHAKRVVVNSTKSMTGHLAWVAQEAWSRCLPYWLCTTRRARQPSISSTRTRNAILITAPTRPRYEDRCGCQKQLRLWWNQRHAGVQTHLIHTAGHADPPCNVHQRQVCRSRGQKGLGWLFAGLIFFVLVRAALQRLEWPSMLDRYAGCVGCLGRPECKFGAARGVVCLKAGCVGTGEDLVLGKWSPNPSRLSAHSVRLSAHLVGAVQPEHGQPFGVWLEADAHATRALALRAACSLVWCEQLGAQRCQLRPKRGCSLTHDRCVGTRSRC